MVVESFSGSIVEFLGDGIQVALGECGEVASFGQVLADEAVEIFVGTALPGGVGIGEVDVDAEVFFDAFESGKFQAVVEGERAAKVLGNVEEAFDDGTVHSLNFPVGDGCCEEKSESSLVECDDSSFVIFADYGIAFPVPVSGTIGGSFGAQIDADTVFNLTAFSFAVTASSSRSMGLPQVFE